MFETNCFASDHMKIIVVTGLPGSGKSAVAQEIGRNKIPVIETGDVIREEVSRQGLEMTLETSEFVARQLRKQYGPDAPIRLIEHKLKESNPDIICVVGPRNLKEVELLSKFGKIIMIIVSSPAGARFRRVRERAKPGDPKEWERFLWRDRKEQERGMKSLLYTTKFMKLKVENRGSFSDLKSNVSRVLKQVRKSP